MCIGLRGFNPGILCINTGLLKAGIEVPGTGNGVETFMRILCGFDIRPSMPLIL
jgi:hypothetical protein